MEEIIELKEFLHQGDIDHALVLAEDLEEMGRKGLAHNIRSYAKVLLTHLIKQQVEQRQTKSWTASIRNAVGEIKEINARPKNKGFYFDRGEIKAIINVAWDGALDKASLQAFEGIYTSQEIEQMLDKEELIEQALTLVAPE